MSKANTIDIPVSQAALVKMLKNHVSYGIEDSEEIYNFLDKALLYALENMWKKKDPRIVSMVEQCALECAEKQVEGSMQYLVEEGQIEAAMEKFVAELKKSSKSK
jgi:hypothetical protein